MSWLATLIATLVKALADIFFQRRDQAQQRTDDKDAGAKDAAIATAKTTAEIADKRSEIAARPDDANSVADRLQSKAERAERGGR